MSAALLSSLSVSAEACAQEWTADDSDIEARKIERYCELAEQSPDKSYAFNQLMKTVGKGERYRSLVAEYEKKAALKPKSFNLQMLLGHMYAYGGQTNDAVTAYRKALAIKQTATAYMAIAEAEAENRNFAEATSAYQAAALLNPTKEQRREIWRALAEIAIYRRDMETARECFGALIQLEPESLFVRRELSQIYVQNRMYAQAREVMDEALKMKSLSTSERDQVELEIAVLYEQEGNDGEALRRYEALSSKLGSGHWMQREILGHIIDIHRRSGSVAALADVLEKQWKAPTYDQHLELADLYDECGNDERALHHLRKAIDGSPKRPEGREKIIGFYRSRGMMSEMFKERESQIKAIPDQPEYRFELYEAYIQNRSLAKALGVLEATAAAFKNDFDTQRRVAEAYQMHGYTSKATALYENWLKRHPNELEALEALGDIYDGAGQKQKAQATWQKIEQLPLNKAIKLEALARIYDEHGYGELSETMYARALSENPKDCQAYSQYADILMRNGKYDQSVQVWEALVSVCKTPEVRRASAQKIAMIAQSRGMENKALTTYAAQAEAHPDDLEKVLFLSEVASAMQMPQTAISATEKYLTHHPESSEAYQALGKLQVEAGDMAAAQATLSKLLDVSETEKRVALLSLAQLDLNQGDLEQARTHLEAALKLNANDAETYETLGDVMFRLRLYQEAANQFETAYQIDVSRERAAMKQATCLSILAKDDEADAIYIKIVSETSDESLALQAAQRAIDDMTWGGKLDSLAQAWLPLLRSSRHKSLIIDILLQVADAQIQPAIMAIQTQEASQTHEVRHKLKTLSETYAQVIVEGLLSDEISLSTRALKLSMWLSSPSVVNVLSKKIETAPQTESGRALQLQALRAVAQAQSPAAVVFLQSCLQPTYARAVREHALWALGLIASPNAMDVLRGALESDLDTFRALAVIGLVRNGAHLSDIRRRLSEDPSPTVRAIAAWGLAFHRVTEAEAEVFQQTQPTARRPYHLWLLSRMNESRAASQVLEALWGSDEANRAMALDLIRSPFKQVDLTQMTQAEMLGTFMKNESNYYMSHFDMDVLLEGFSQLSLGQPSLTHVSSWLVANESDLAIRVRGLASDSGENARARQSRMLGDLLEWSSISDIKEDFWQRIVALLEPQLVVWMEGESEAMSSLSMRALLMAQTSERRARVVKVAQTDSRMARRLSAIEALGRLSDSETRGVLMALANDPDYLVRAAVIRVLTPESREEKALIQAAQNDDYAVVSKTAQARLKGGEKTGD